MDLLHDTPASFTHYQHNPNNPSSLRNNDIRGLLEDSNGRFWVGTDDGLHLFYPDKGKFFPYIKREDRASSISDNRIRCLYEDRSGLVWIGTFTGGVIKAGGINGLTRFYPSEIKNNPNAPPIVLTSFKIKGNTKPLFQVLNPTGQIRLEYDQNYFSVEFSALDYTHPSLNRYAYKLDNIDKDWIDLGHRHFVNFTNLDGGDYVLHIKGSNSDQVWNNAGIAIPVHIDTPLWESWWAYLLYSGVLIAGIGLFIRAKTKKHVKELQYKNEQVRHLQQLDNFRAEAFKNQERYRQLFEDSSDAIFITQRDGWIIDINPSAEALFKVSKSDIKKINPATFFVKQTKYRTISDAVSE